MENSLALSERKQTGGMIEVALSRQTQEVQAAMVIAQRFPRDTNRAFARLMEDCKRKSLAEKAHYSYPRGKGAQAQIVSGPSIRLAEAVAKAYGNLDFGVIELEKKSGVGGLPGESTVMAYCWDLETNTRSSKVFTIAHRRDTKAGGYNLTDERDIYEITANNGARRLRACILSIVPADIVEAASNACRETLKNGTEPLVDRVRKMIVYAKEVGVTQVMIEKYLSHSVDVMTDDQMIDLRGVFTAIKDGHAAREDVFDLNAGVDPKDVTPVAEAKTETKTLKSLKNHAPASKEEAEKTTAEIKAKTSVVEPVVATADAPPEKKATPTRGELIVELSNLRAELNMTPDEFLADCVKLTKKNKITEITSPELAEIIDVYKIRVANKEG